MRPLCAPAQHCEQLSRYEERYEAELLQHAPVSVVTSALRLRRTRL